MRLFLDSSALAKRYVNEPGTPNVILRCEEATEILLSVLCIPELISGFNRLKREGKISPAKYRNLKRSLGDDVKQASIIEVTPAVVDRTISCLESTGSRALDAIQLASAQELMCDLFLTADQKQYQDALRIGLKAEAVSNHLH